MSAEYLVGLTPDGFHEDGTCLFGGSALDPLHAAGIRAEIVGEPGSPVGHGAFRECDAVVSFGQMPFREEHLAEMPRLRHIARFGSGTDGIDVAALARRGVTVTNTPEAVRAPLASAALALILACAHRLLPNDRIVREGAWARSRGRRSGPGLFGRTVGIVGYGSVARRLAGLLEPFGVEITAHTRNPAGKDAPGVRFGSLQEVAATADFLVVTAALTGRTRHLVDGAVLAAMKPEAYLINISRGGLVDQEALVSALRAGSLAGAGLDVTDPEPLPAGHPLCSFEDVVLSPHALCWTEDFTAAVAHDVADALADVRDHGTSTFALH